MKNSKPKILLGFDFAGVSNFPAALYSVQRWMQYAQRSNEYDVIFGVSISASRGECLLGSNDLTVDGALKVISQYANITTVWDNTVTVSANRILTDANIVSCQPYYEVFNYGSLVNRLLLLANVNDCQYFVRFDPGTLPPNSSSFDEMMGVHRIVIGQTDRVVSRGYEGRTSLRDIYVDDSIGHSELLTVYTDIVPERQVTGGAMFTSPVPGIPAICFDKSSAGLTLVWGSDDAYFQILPETNGSQKIDPSSIPRFDPVGKVKPNIEYYRGIAGMVFLSNYLQKGKYKFAAEKTAEYLRVIHQSYLVPAKYIFKDPDQTIEQEFVVENIAPNAYLDKIVEGYKNHRALLANGTWQKIAQVLKDNVSSLPTTL